MYQESQGHAGNGCAELKYEEITKTLEVFGVPETSTKMDLFVAFTRPGIVVKDIKYVEESKTVLIEFKNKLDASKIKNLIDMREIKIGGEYAEKLRARHYKPKIFQTDSSQSTLTNVSVSGSGTSRKTNMLLISGWTPNSRNHEVRDLKLLCGLFGSVLSVQIIKGSSAIVTMENHYQANKIFLRALSPAKLLLLNEPLQVEFFYTEMNQLLYKNEVYKLRKLVEKSVLDLQTQINDLKIEHKNQISNLKELIQQDSRKLELENISSQLSERSFLEQESSVDILDQVLDDIVL